MTEDKKTLVLIDGSGYIFRAFYALPPMTRSDGTPVNAVYGFTSMLMKLVEDLSPDYIGVVFDVARRTFRSDLYEEYKANRPEPPDELKPQFALVREATAALSLSCLEAPGFEADDLIATYAKISEESGLKTVIVSSDKDLMQLVRGDITMLDPIKQRKIGYDEVIDRFGVPPQKVTDVQALAGDTTDNVPGIPGIGVKTASELINDFGDLETLLLRADEIKQPKRRENLIKFSEQARVSLSLVKLREDVPISHSLQDLKSCERDIELLSEFLRRQEFNRLLARIGVAEYQNGGATNERVVRSMGKGLGPSDFTPAYQQEAPHVNKPKSSSNTQLRAADLLDMSDLNYQLVNDIETLKSLMSAAQARGVIAVDTETSSLNAAEATLVGISIALEPGEAYYIPLRHGDSDLICNGEKQSSLGLREDHIEEYEQLSFLEAIDILKPVLEDLSVLKVGHNLKYDAHVLSWQRNGGIELAPVDDTMCLSYVLDGGRVSSHSLDNLAQHWLNHETIKYGDVCGKGSKQIPFNALDPKNALDYAAEDADVSLRLWYLFKPRLSKEGLTSVYERIERPLIPILAAMESRGIIIDRQNLKRLSGDFAGRMILIQDDIHNLAGENFNIASPKQLGEILFNKMGLTGGKKSKTGAYSTSAEVLEELAASGTLIAEKVLEWRHLAKLKSTYADALAHSILSETGRVHTSFSMVGASTGRLSSSDPNVQNIPIRTVEGRQIREAFVAAPNKQIISADYSQIELRLIAHVAGESSMIAAFEEGVDIHAQTAAEVFGLPISEMDSETRRRAKAINFGIVYGISAFGLARQLGVHRGEAGEYIKKYFENFPKIKDYMEQIKLAAREDGYIQTIFGRRVHISGFDSSNQAVRGFAERQAINAPIQGSAADIIKRAMIRLPSAMSEAGLSAEMLLQVHDELIFEVDEEDAALAANLIKVVMESAASPAIELSVPLVVEAGIASNWALAH